MTYNKYSNIKTEVDGIKFDSRKEATHYGQLKMLLRSKVIKELKLQPAYVLQEGFIDKGGTKHRPLTYVADFEYIDEKGKLRVEDCKGMKTDVYKIKKKLFLFKYPDVLFQEI